MYCLPLAKLWLTVHLAGILSILHHCHLPSTHPPSISAFPLREKIYNCQKPSSLFKVLQGHSYHISRSWKEGQKEVVGIIWRFALPVISLSSPPSPDCTPGSVLLSASCWYDGSENPIKDLGWVLTNTYDYPRCSLPPLCLLGHWCNWLLPVGYW